MILIKEPKRDPIPIPVVRRTVDEMLFSGYATPFVVQAIRLARKIMPYLLVDSPERFGFFVGRNESMKDHFVVGTGAGDVPFTKIIKWNGLSELPFWGSKQCNQINGTDGSQFPPFLQTYEKLQVFSPELCRSLDFERETATQVRGIETQR